MATIDKLSLRELYDALSTPWDASIEKLIDKYQNIDKELSESSVQSNDSVNKLNLKNLANERYESDDEKGANSQKDKELENNSLYQKSDEESPQPNDQQIVDQETRRPNVNAKSAPDVQSIINTQLQIMQKQMMD